MKKVIFALFLIFLIMFIKDISSNPVVFHFINEFMISEDSWKLELHSSHSTGDPISLDGSYLTSTTDTAYFKEGISIYLEDYIVITPDSMQSNLDINPNGDIISIFFGEHFTDMISFGIPGYYSVPALNNGQSMNIYSYSESGWSHIGYYLDNSPTFSFENDTINANGNIEGFIKDSLDNPVEGVRIIYGYEEIYPGDPIFVETNSAGYSMFRDLSVLKHLKFEKSGYFAPDTSIQVWPDSTITLNIFMQPVVGVTELPSPQELNFELSQNYPNPFNNSTIFNYTITEDGFVEINIYDEKGELIHKLFKGNQSRGKYKVTWNADNLASGIYFYQIKTKNQKLAKKCLLLK